MVFSYLGCALISEQQNVEEIAYVYNNLGQGVATNMAMGCS